MFDEGFRDDALLSLYASIIRLLCFKILPLTAHKGFSMAGIPCWACSDCRHATI